MIYLTFYKGKLMIFKWYEDYNKDDKQNLQFH